MSGASSLLGELRTERFCFPLMAMPHAHDPSGNASRGPDKYNQTRIEPADRNESRLTIVKSIIDPGEMISGNDLFGPTHIEAPPQQSALPFLGIAGYAHVFNVATLKDKVKTTPDAA
jgi:hypothetical protein